MTRQSVNINYSFPLHSYLTLLVIKSRTLHDFNIFFLVSFRKCIVYIGIVFIVSFVTYLECTCASKSDQSKKNFQLYEAIIARISVFIRPFFVKAAPSGDRLVEQPTIPDWCQCPLYFSLHTHTNQFIPSPISRPFHHYLLL